MILEVREGGGGANHVLKAELSWIFQFLHSANVKKNAELRDFKNILWTFVCSAHEYTYIEKSFHSFLRTKSAPFVPSEDELLQWKRIAKS